MIISVDENIPQPADGAVEVHLLGGPEGMPRKLWLPGGLASDEKLKIRYLAGYEHYERTPWARGTTGSGLTFTWSMRTRIAE